jgi:hypothetical protein
VRRGRRNSFRDTRQCLRGQRQARTDGRIEGRKFPSMLSNRRTLTVRYCALSSQRRPLLKINGASISPVSHFSNQETRAAQPPGTGELRGPFAVVSLSRRIPSLLSVRDTHHAQTYRVFTVRPIMLETDFILLRRYYLRVHASEAWTWRWCPQSLPPLLQGTAPIITAPTTPNLDYHFCGHCRA